MRKQKSNSDCQRCGEYFSMFGERHVELADNAYVASLCANCHNDFFVFIDNCPTWVAYITNIEAAHMLYARTCGDGVDRSQEVEQMRAERFELHKELHRICGNWIVESEEKAPASRGFAPPHAYE